ncbi:MAG: hypothetical protein GOV02_01050 [Candidatus Aenigmarchaeota archaeon]|nr:hypothetical protein [Candidatus Aenigmarchaeota archaeon]
MANNNIFAFCLSFMVISIMFSSIVFAGLSASPATVDFDNLLRGGYAEQFFVIKNIDVDPAEIRIGPEGEIAEWINVVGENVFVLEGNEARIVKIAINPPLDAANGEYHTTIFITAIPLNNVGKSGVFFTWGIDIPTNVIVTDQQVSNYTVEAFTVSNAEECKIIQYSINVYNRGNVRLTPRYHATILNVADRSVVKEFYYTAEELLPTQIRTDIVRIPYELAQFRCIPQGEYLLKVDAYLEDQMIYTRDRFFEILEPGALTILGNLKGIDYPEEVELGEVVKIDGTFRNVGEESLVSKLRCEIYSEDERLLEFVESDQREVAVATEEILTVFYTPKGPGEQIVHCVVNYENKQTPPVRGPLSVTIPIMWIYVGILLLIIIIIIIVWKVTKSKVVIQ